MYWGYRMRRQAGYADCGDINPLFCSRQVLGQFINVVAVPGFPDSHSHNPNFMIGRKQLENNGIALPNGSYAPESRHIPGQWFSLKSGFVFKPMALDMRSFRMRLSRIRRSISSLSEVKNTVQDITRLSLRHDGQAFAWPAPFPSGLSLQDQDRP